MDINISILVGRLADNVRFEPGVQGGRASRAVGRIIVNRRPGRDGKKRYDAIQICAWGRNAENLAEYTSKGKELGIIGEIRTNSIAPQVAGGQWKNYTEVLIHFMSFGKDSAEAKAMKAFQTGGPAAMMALGAMGFDFSVDPQIPAQLPPGPVAVPQQQVNWQALLSDPSVAAEVQSMTQAAAAAVAPQSVAVPQPAPVAAQMPVIDLPAPPPPAPAEEVSRAEEELARAAAEAQTEAVEDDLTSEVAEADAKAEVEAEATAAAPEAAVELDEETEEEEISVENPFPDEDE